MRSKLLPTLALSFMLTSAHALTVAVNFVPTMPAQVDFAYAVSTGNCSKPKSVNCHFNQMSSSGIDSAHFGEYLNAVNAVFKGMTPVVDKFHKPTNFIEIKIPGQRGVCHVDLLGKSTIAITMNQDGTCLK